MTFHTARSSPSRVPPGVPLTRCLLPTPPGPREGRVAERKNLGGLPGPDQSANEKIDFPARSVGTMAGPKVVWMRTQSLWTSSFQCPTECPHQGDFPSSLVCPLSWGFSNHSTLTPRLWLCWQPWSWLCKRCADGCAQGGDIPPFKTVRAIRCDPSSRRRGGFMMSSLRTKSGICSPKAGFFRNR